MDLTRIEIDLEGRRARLTMVDARGENRRELDGEGYAKIESAAAGLIAAIESTIGGACHLALQSIEIDTRARRIRVRAGEERVLEGAQYQSLTRDGQVIGHVARAAVSALGPRPERHGSPSEPAFWGRVYQEPTQGFELMRATPPLERWLLTHPPAAKRALVVGCGRGHEARLLARLGARVVAIDFAPQAIAEAAALARAEAVEVDFRERDLFELAKEPERYDLIVEHCCFCAIEPSRRDEYARVMRELLADGGALVGLFWQHGRAGGPPFTVDRKQLRAHFGAGFEIVHEEIPIDSVALRAGQEILLALRRR
jgi:SAM-dependent methyltransferase